MRRGQQGKHTYAARWNRERQRSPEIAAIRPGDQIVKRWKGADLRITCHDGFWTLNESWVLPTLYSAVVAIAGTKERARAGSTEKRSTANWSASRFFKLKPR